MTKRIMLTLTAAAVTAGLLATAGAHATPDAEGSHRRAVQQVLDRMTTVDRLPGAQAVVLDGRMRTLKSGLGDLERGTPMPGADGYLRGASNLKSMVATVILQLVAEGKITLDAPVATYLPGLIPPGAGDEHKIEIRHLLQHTSGIHNHSEEITYGEDLKPYKHYTRPDLLNLSFAKAPDFPPGEPGRWHYSNTGYVLLGMVIEKVTGHAWRDEVKARVFDPAGMTDTYFPGDYEYGIRAPHARGYLQLPKPGGGIATADVTDYDTSGGDAAGAGNTTSRDLLRFYTALLGGKLVRPDLLAEMKRYVSTPDPRLKLGYGLGLGHFTLPCGGEAWGNGGNTEGFQTLSGVVLDDHGHITRAATVFTNTTFNESNVDGALDQFQALYAALC